VAGRWGNFYYVGALTWRGLWRAFWRVSAVLAVVALLLVGLVEVGLIANPFAWNVSGDLALARSDRPGLRVLFIGNSLTYRNGMPSLVRQLARSDGTAGQPMFVVQDTKGGGTLHSASEDGGVAKLLAEVRWNIVVLQEQSQLESLPLEQRQRLSYPYARDLQRKIRAAGARTVLFLTWAYKNGNGRVRDDSFENMQARLIDGYAELGAELEATIAPVGIAWAVVHERVPDLALWAGDGIHPSKYGSYLAACVFYAMFSGRDVTTNSFTAGINPEWAAYLRAIAATAAEQGSLNR
jgi:hypothetical protein